MPTVRLLLAVLALGLAQAPPRPVTLPPVTERPESAVMPRDPRQPDFRAETARVEVSFIAVDRRNRPIVDLGADDLEVFEDGARRPVASFAAVRSGRAREQPAHTASAPGDLPRTWNGFATNASVSASRLIAVILDDLHIDVRRTSRARAAARGLLERLEPGDLLYVGTTSSALSTGSFSRDRSLARQMIDGMTGQRLPDRTIGQRRFPGRDFEGERLDHFARLCAAIRNLAASLRGVTGRRKSLLLISEGSSITAGMSDLGATPAAGSASRALLDTLAAAAAADLAIYPLNPAGLDSFDGDLVEGSGLVTPEILTAIREEFVQAKVMTRQLASVTGGVSFVDSNDIDAPLDRVLQDAGQHYVLSYEPPTSSRRGFRRIEVRIRRPGARAIARPGYWVGEHGLAGPAVTVTGGVPPALASLLAGVVPDAGVPIQLQAVPVTRAGSNTRVAIVAEIDGSSLRATMDGARLQIDQALVTVDADGNVSNGTHRSVSVTLTSSQRDALAASALRSVWAVDLTAGLHHVRFAARDALSGRAGSVQVRVDVPGDGISPDGVLIASRILSVMPTAYVDERLADWTFRTPTATRVFPREDELTVTLPGRHPGMTAAVRLLDASGGAVWEGTIEPADASGIMRAVVPLATAPAGLCEIAVSMPEREWRIPIIVIARTSTH